MEEGPSERLQPPTFFAVCKAEEGIVLVAAWEAEEDHKAFRKQMMPHLHAAGVPRPKAHEHLQITRLGWDPCAGRSIVRLGPLRNAPRCWRDTA